MQANHHSPHELLLPHTTYTADTTKASRKNCSRPPKKGKGMTKVGMKPKPPKKGMGEKTEGAPTTVVLFTTVVLRLAKGA